MIYGLWLSQVPVLSFSSFDTESGYDYVYVYDGEDSDAVQLGEFHGTDTPDDQTGSGSQLYVQLSSDSISHGAGFTATFGCLAQSASLDPVLDGVLVGDPCDGGASAVDSGTLDGAHGADADCAWALSCSDSSQVPRQRRCMAFRASCRYLIRDY